MVGAALVVPVSKNAQKSGERRLRRNTRVRTFSPCPQHTPLAHAAAPHIRYGRAHPRPRGPPAATHPSPSYRAPGEQRESAAAAPAKKRTRRTFFRCPAPPPPASRPPPGPHCCPCVSEGDPRPVDVLNLTACACAQGALSRAPAVLRGALRERRGPRVCARGAGLSPCSPATQERLPLTPGREAPGREARCWAWGERRTSPHTRTRTFEPAPSRARPLSETKPRLTSPFSPPTLLPQVVL